MSASEPVETTLEKEFMTATGARTEAMVSRAASAVFDLMIHRTVVLISVLSVAAAADHAEVALGNGYSQLYNLQFEEAHGTFRQWERLHASDPIGPVSDAAAFLFEELDRLQVHLPARLPRPARLIPSGFVADHLVQMTILDSANKRGWR
jgi:hypothetical protein